jgi:hypothetical protein
MYDGYAPFTYLALGCFITADVFQTLTQALKEGVKSKKTLEFTLILANQMVYSREMERFEGTQPPNQKSRIQMMVAYQKMKQAFQNANKPEVSRSFHLANMC